jgi:hypothetical protein
MRDQFRPIATNLTPVNVVGIPGLMLVIVAITLAIQFPEARWLIAAGVSGGLLIAAALIVRRSRRSDGSGGDPSQSVLHVYDPIAAPPDGARSRVDHTQILVPVGC